MVHAPSSWVLASVSSFALLAGCSASPSAGPAPDAGAPHDAPGLRDVAATESGHVDAPVVDSGKPDATVDGASDASPPVSDSGDPTTLPLLQASSIQYLGAFALPGSGVAGGWFGYGGRGVSPYFDPTGKHTIFLEGQNAQDRNLVAQIEIPATFSTSQTYADLPVANVLQPFYDVEPGATSVDPTDSNGINFFGGLVYGGRLLVTNAEWYGTGQDDTGLSIGWKDSTNLAAMDFHGFYGVSAVANARAVAGHPLLVPTAWQALLGGPVMVGNCCLSIISAQSAGPSVTVIDPAGLGATPVAGTTLLFYPISATTDHALCDPTTTQCASASPETQESNVYNLTTTLGGYAFPAGSRTLLALMTQGTGKYCYGAWTDQPALDGTLTSDGVTVYCLDYAGNYSADKGPHAWPYRYQWLAYDVNDLVAVKAGTKQTYDPKPYGVWPDTNMDWVAGMGSAIVWGAGFDPSTNNVYVAVDFGNNPMLNVFHVTVP